MIPIIDLFAGPGGLGEGFSAFESPERIFKIKTSIEMDEVAHKTLLLRSFYRQFSKDDVPQKYYDFLQRPKFKLDELNTLLDSFPEGTLARSEALCLELGKHDEKIYKHIELAIIDRIENNLPWVLIGGPPCQAYSLVGRARNKNKIINETENELWSLDKDPRSRLYEEYLKVIAKFQPAVFVMENVIGMLSAKIGNNQVIDLITSDLHNPNKIKKIDVLPISGKHYSYKLFSLIKEQDENETFESSDFVIKCENYGIPQRRHRVIILGVREDCLGHSFDILKKENQISIKETIDDLPPCYATFSNRKTGLSKLDDKLSKYNDYQEMIKDYFAKIKLKDNEFKQVLNEYSDNVGKKKPGPKNNIFAPEWFLSERLEGHFCNHEPRTHIRSDLLRYFFASCYGKAFRASPKLKDFPGKLLPAHQNSGEEKFVDRFKVQLEDIPSTTITCHISKDGHYYIHPDPRQCRSLTVREAARLQTFPDDYFFCGNRTQQYHQVGNAVPPLLAKKIAKIVHQILK